MLENRIATGLPPTADVIKRILLPVGVLLLAMIGLGQVATRTLAHEDGVNRWLAARRTGPLDLVSAFFSVVGSTPCIVVVTALVAFVLLRKLHDWHVPVFLCAAVTAQAIVFYFTTLAIDRQRPAVPHMDESPPTSSFPSGHTSAAVALYGGLALVLAGLVRRTWTRWLCWSLLLLPLAVGLARLYRGMHHPSDVAASFLNGGLCVAIMAIAIRTTART